jgi:tetratricopeptide (TPR) repeat protein
MVGNRYVVVLSFFLAIGVVGCKTDPEVAKRRYLESGQRYFDKGQFAEATIQYRKALQIDPRYADAYYHLGLADLKLREWQEAYKAFNQLILVDPANVKAHTELFSLYLSGHQYTEAQQEADTLVTLDPKSAYPQQLVGTVAMARQRYQDALEAFGKARDLSNGDAPSQLNVALVQIALTQYAEAEKTLQLAIQKDAHFVPGYLNLANLYRVQSKNTDAVQALRAGLQGNPDSQEITVELARILSATGDPAGAEQLISQLRSSHASSPEAHLAIGDFYSDQAQLDKALASYQEGLRIAPKNDALRLKALNLLVAMGKANEANDLDTQILKDDPTNIPGRIVHARLQMIAPATAGAGFDELKKIVQDAPDIAEAHYYLGQAYLQNGDGQHALAEFEEAVRHNGNSVPSLHAAAELQVRAKSLDAATDYAQRCIRLRPTSAAERLLLGDILMRKGEAKGAIEQLRAAVQLAPNDENAHVTLAQAYASTKDYKNAESELDSALRVSPKSTFVLGSIADYWIARGQPAKAVEQARKFVAADPKNADAQAILGSALLSAKSYPEAQAVLEESVKAKPNLFQTYVLLGKLHTLKGDTQPAIDAYSHAIALQPRYAPLYAALGNIYLDKKDFSSAQKYFEQCLKIDPEFGVAASNLAWIYALEGGNLDVAVGLAQKAKQLLPDTASVSDTLAWVYVKRGNFSSAVPLLQESIKKNPQSALYRYHLGIALMGKGDTAKGRAELETALRLKLAGDEADQAHRALAQLH